MDIIPSDQVEANGYAQFNVGPHLCLDVPDGHFTISARTSEGKLITFAFVPYKKDGPPQCVDVKQHNTGKIVKNGDVELPAQRIICFTVGYDTFRSTHQDKNPTTLTSVLIGNCHNQEGNT